LHRFYFHILANFQKPFFTWLTLSSQTLRYMHYHAKIEYGVSSKTWNQFHDESQRWSIERQVYSWSSWLNYTNLSSIPRGSHSAICECVLVIHMLFLSDHHITCILKGSVAKRLRCEVLFNDCKFAVGCASEIILKIGQWNSLQKLGVLRRDHKQNKTCNKT